MNFRQLRVFSEIVNQGFKVTKAAETLHMSQPSVSRYVTSLETELGIPVFLRVDKRIAGLSRGGNQLLVVARRLLNEADNLQKMSRELSSDNTGELAIGASHTAARYRLPNIVVAFKEKYPGVRLTIRQGDPRSLGDLVAAGQLDLAVSPNEYESVPRELVNLECDRHDRIVIAPVNHPLSFAGKPTIEQLADFPLITYTSKFGAQAQLLQAFRRSRLIPNIVLTASDVDVMKTYVRCGLGIAIVTARAYDEEHDRDLRAISISNLLPSVTASVWLRRGNFLRSHAYDFITILHPALTKERVEHMLYTA